MSNENWFWVCLSAGLAACTMLLASYAATTNWLWVCLPAGQAACTMLLASFAATTNN